MWTNVFKIGGLHQISWFQFLPHESDLTPLDKSSRAEQRDAATFQVLSSHLQLQKEGCLSTWTNSFVGPWDPSQGLHNPDEKIKLWLFIPGRHSSVSESAQTAVSKLRVVASGLWVAPGDSEEVAIALSQALRNCIERALMGLSYVRFGDVFTKYHSFSQSEDLFRKGQPTIEFVFAATEEAIFVHVIVSAKLVRALSGGDMERVLQLSSNGSSGKLPVIVSPHGMRGRLTGCCPSDLVKQLYIRSGMLRTSTGFVGLPHHISQASGCKLRGRNCFVEVMLGHVMSGSETGKQSNSNRNISNSVTRGAQVGSAEDSTVCEKVFIYAPEAVIVPFLQTSYARSSLKRFWLQNWMGPSFSSSTVFMHCCACELDAMDGSSTEPNQIRSQNDDNSSSNSNSSSISSINCTSSDSDCKMKASASDLEADADSLTCRKSGLSSVDPIERNGLNQGAKRPRTGLGESFGQVGTVINASIQDAYKSDFNHSAITGQANDQVGARWDWDDDDSGVGMDIQALLSEFGDFGDFFETDVLPFGEPPGTAESQTLMFSGPEYTDVGGTPSGGVMEGSDQMLLPVNFPTFESFNPPPSVMEECVSTVQEAMRSTSSFAPGSYPPAASAGEFDHVMKSEALMTFASEYRAVETLSSEVSSAIFRSPYLPKSRKLESLNSTSSCYVYGATPPPSPCGVGSDEKPSMSADSRLSSAKVDIGANFQTKFYRHVESGKDSVVRKLVRYNNVVASSEGTTPIFSGFNHTNTIKLVQNKRSEVTHTAERLLLSLKTVPAAELECLMFQASMCRIRHSLLSSSNPSSVAWNRYTRSTVLSQLPSDPSTMTDNLCSRYEVKKESIPVRIAGGIDGGMLDGPVNAPVGIWRSVGVPKGAKPANAPTNEIFPSVSPNEETMISYGQRQPLQDLLDGMAFLVQQAASFVDVVLDAECGDGPYGWLALQEQWRRGFCCGPHMVHAGCGGILASGHSLDIAGVELVDPLSADVHASSVISLLQSDMKAALKSAFGTLDGPLSVTDWCKGCFQSGDAGGIGDGFSAESSLSECTAMASIVDKVSPLQTSASVPSTFRDGGKGDDSCQRRPNQELCMMESEQQLGSRRSPTLFVVPLPSILVGYQDDWLKTSASSIHLWEKVPFEPYAFQKHMTYYVVCPNIDPLTSAAADFFQQLGTVYETCKLGTHSPQSLGNQMEVDSGKLSSSGFVLLDCPQAMKIESTHSSLVGLISDYFLSLSNGWDLTSFLKSLKKVLRALKFGSSSSKNTKEGNSSPCTVIYVVCPFPDHTAVLQTLIESSVAVGSVIFPKDSDRRSTLQSQVQKALSCSAGVDEASASNIVALSGFSIPKLVLQIVTIDVIFRVTNPTLSELIILKEIAFTVYNKARRISRGSSNDVVHPSPLSGRSHSVTMQTPNSIPGMWKDCIVPRISNPSLPRESDLDSGLRAGAWDNTWQTLRSGGLSCDPNRVGDFPFQEEVHHMFEPLFILAEPGSMELGVSPIFTGNVGSDKQLSDDSSGGGFIQSSSSTVTSDTGPSSHLDGSEADGFGSGLQKSPASLHCCYGWTEDWRWLVCIWTDSRGELLDSHIFPFGGISSRQDTKGMQSLFVQILQQGCQILQACTSSDTTARPRDFIITRIGCFYELECQEWQKALYSIGGSEVKKWPMQLQRAMPDGMPTSNNGGSLQQQEIDRSLPSSPSPLYSPHTKSSGFIKGGLGQSSRKQLIGGSAVADSSRGLLQWVQSISFVTISVDHSLQLVFQAETSPGSSQGGGIMGTLSYLEGYTPVRSLGSASASYFLIPSPSMRFLSPAPLQLPTCLTAESPPLAHLLHSRGSAIPLSTGFVVSKAVPSLKNDASQNAKEEWPSVLSVSLIDYCGAYNVSHEKLSKGAPKQGGRGSVPEARDYEIESHSILESVAAELHALSWMTVSPAYLERRTALPFHCDMVLRLRRLLHFAEKELSC
ncbi:hypothetical protein Nepgr_012110 [Nepenthes gracilis]|uniref:Mediator of RNA polymerase II transcription subunit 13 n=1 Tax=Nepenthes gracilis TaxID=150966 RepID=A0AAD3SGE6_NEPGR|nr:hypothetical protein Nepgr_012110 [Nepenthes gracilis]